ncbi:hypothetical protein G6F38_001951 [Rhizopus arrhizus]|nr:hypothetical protein G6F38_001951 [Rhizopus arrhizus]
MASSKDNKKATKVNKKVTKSEKKEVTKKPKAEKKVEQKKEESSESDSSDSSDSSDEEEEEEKKEESSESSDSSNESSESSSEEEEEKMEVDEKKEESSEESSDSSDEEESKGKKRKAEEEQEEVPVPKAAKTEENYTIWCGGISFEATADDVREFFGECGEIKDVRIRTDEATGKNRGFCHIDFATQEAKDAAVALSGNEFLGRRIRIDGADGGKKTNTSGPASATKKVFVANLNRDYDEDAHRTALTEAFQEFGTIVGDIRLPYNRESGALKGIGYIEFETTEQAEAAVKGMNGVEINGRALRTDFSGDNDRDRFSGNRGGRGGFRGGRGDFRGGRGDFRGGRGGRGGNRGGFRGGRGGFAPRGSHQKF